MYYQYFNKLELQMNILSNPNIGYRSPIFPIIGICISPEKDKLGNPYQQVMIVWQWVSMNNTKTLKL